jgi:hypothetical protein
MDRADGEVRSSGSATGQLLPQGWVIRAPTTGCFGGRGAKTACGRTEKSARVRFARARQAATESNPAVPIRLFSARQYLGFTVPQDAMLREEMLAVDAWYDEQRRLQFEPHQRETRRGAEHRRARRDRAYRRAGVLDAHRRWGARAHAGAPAAVLREPVRAARHGQRLQPDRRGALVARGH